VRLVLAAVLLICVVVALVFGNLFSGPPITESSAPSTMSDGSDLPEAPVPQPEGDQVMPGSGGGGNLNIGAMSDAEAWAAVENSTDPAAFQMYLYHFPSGQFAAQAYVRLVELSPETAAPIVDAPEPAVEALPPPPPPEPATSPADDASIRIIRHPTLDAPEQTVAGEEFTVTVALTEEQLTPDVVVKPGPGSSLTPDGALEFSLSAASEQWPIDIDLLAAGFDLTGGSAWSRRVTLFKAGDSDFARFTLKARAIRDGSRPRQLIARLYHAGDFLGSVSRPVIVFRDQVAMGMPALEPAPGEGGASAEPAAALLDAPGRTVGELATDIRLRDIGGDAADLEVTVNYSDPDNLGDGVIYIHSRHSGAPVIAEFTTPEGMTGWLNAEYVRLVDLGLKLRGAVPLASEPADPEARKRFIAKVAEGLGLDLYRNYVPDAFKREFWSLKSQGKLRSIQITSNSPVLPWELVVPEAADGTPDGFLGISYRLARWAPRIAAGQVDRPLDRMAFTGVATIAPAYADNSALPFQKVEVDALSKLAGFRLVGGDFSSFEKLVGEVSTGFIHFSGHGEVNDPGTGSPVFAIRLLDQALDPTTWRALTFAPHDQGNPFFFFNACDTGRARSLGGFVQGWGPAILASGASGFIGGMWPLSDRTAASFSTSFYAGISDHLNDGPVYVAEVLQGVRKQFYETGDPTYLAYTFYGNANLQVVSR